MASEFTTMPMAMTKAMPMAMAVTATIIAAEMAATIMAAEMAATPAILNPKPTKAGTKHFQTATVTMMIEAAAMMQAILSTIAETTAVTATMIVIATTATIMTAMIARIMMRLPTRITRRSDTWDDNGQNADRIFCLANGESIRKAICYC